MGFFLINLETVYSCKTRTDSIIIKAGKPVNQLTSYFFYSIFVKNADDDIGFHL